jgi:hypothetical protein
VFAAVLGLAHFAAEMPADWTFVRIPEGRVSTPDIWAVHGSSQPWNIEMKGSAPLADAASAVVLDACARVLPRAREGKNQLQNSITTRPTGTPGIRLAGISGAAGPISGGKALAVTILPEVALLQRRDLLAADKRGCPTDAAGRTMPCRDKCLGVNGQSATATTVLWAEQTQGGSHAVNHGLLPVLHRVVLAAWSSSRKATEMALGALGERLIEHHPELSPEQLATLALGALRETERVATVASRMHLVRLVRSSIARERSLVDQLVQAGSLGVAEDEDPTSLSPENIHTARGDVVLESDSGPWHGRRLGKELRLVPPMQANEDTVDAQQFRQLYEASFLPELERVSTSRRGEFESRNVEIRRTISPGGSPDEVRQERRHVVGVASWTFQRRYGYLWEDDLAEILPWLWALGARPQLFPTVLATNDGRISFRP